MALLKAFRRSRDIAFERLEGSDPQVIAYSWIAAAIAEQRELMGENYWAYNVQDNVRTLEAMMAFSHQLGITPGKLDFESFLHPEAAALPGG